MDKDYEVIRKNIDLLTKAIDKWVNIIQGGSDEGTSNCALCKEYCHQSKNSCGACPVQVESGSHCKGTPYNVWASHHYIIHMNNYSKKIECEECKTLAYLELNYLTALLDKEIADMKLAIVEITENWHVYE